MRNEPPTFERPRRGESADAATHGDRRINTPVFLGILLFGILSLYSSLALATQVDELYFPGNGISLPVSIPGTNQRDSSDVTSIKDRINILFLGLDQRLDEPDNVAYRTDTVAILTIDQYSKTAAEFSIPRDTLVEIPDGAGGYTTDRINVAWEMGQYTAPYADYPDGGPGLVKDTIEHNFKIPINNYVIMNWNAFIEVINELGGVDINVPEYAYDPAYEDCNACAPYEIEFVPGLEHMDGERALAYARIRHSDNDYKRIERQQLVLKAMAKKASSLNLFDAGKAKSLYDKYKHAVETDISDSRLPGLALLAKQIGPDNIKTVSATPATYPCTVCVAAVLNWHPDIMSQLIAQVFSDGRLANEAATVKVVNATPTADFAADFAGFLKDQGVPDDHITVDEYADGHVYSGTLIINAAGKSYTADRLKKWLNLADTRVVSGTDPQATPFADQTANIVVVLGTDAHIPPSTGAALTGVQIGGGYSSGSSYTDSGNSSGSGSGDTGSTFPGTGATATPIETAAATPEPTAAPTATATGHPAPSSTDVPIETPAAGG